MRPPKNTDCRYAQTLTANLGQLVVCRDGKSSAGCAFKLQTSNLPLTDGMAKSVTDQAKHNGIACVTYELEGADNDYTTASANYGQACKALRA